MLNMKSTLIFSFLLVLVGTSYGLPKSGKLQEEPAVTRLRTYLRFESAHPNPEQGYEQAVEWLRQQAQEIGLEFNFLDLGEPNQFALWMTWKGSDPDLKSIMLNSHIDVVSSEPEKWQHPPFEAYKDGNGNIFARGAVDMKSATVAELEAIRRLKASGFQPLRTIHLTAMPDEEVGGMRGMIPFIQTDQFKNLNVGIDIDEGFPTGSNNLVHITYAEKTVWQFNITARGEASHASNLPHFTAAQKLQVVIDRLMEYRESEYQKMQSGNATIDQLTTINLVQLGGGIADNIIPDEVWASFDMRIWLRPDWNFTDIENMLNNIMREASLGTDAEDEVSIKFILQSFDSKRTIANDSNIWWTVVQNACKELEITCDPHVLSAATDGRYVREVDIPVFGICPFLAQNIAHQVNEYINEAEFLKGIDRYVTLIKHLVVLPGDSL